MWWGLQGRLGEQGRLQEWLRKAPSVIQRAGPWRFSGVRDTGNEPRGTSAEPEVGISWRVSEKQTLSLLCE